MENVIVIQNDPAFIQEDGDIARLVACRHSMNKVPDLMQRRVIFKPYMVDNLDVVSVPVEDDMGDRKVDVWIDITLGVFPDTEPLNDAVKIGDNLTLSVYVKDSANNTDIRIKDCYAYDNIKSAKYGIKPAQLQLSEENGCPLRENLLGVWRRTLNTMNTEATMIAFNTLKAFKFPEKDSVFLACNIDLCRENCTERCEAEPVNPDEEPPMMDDDQQQQQQQQGNQQDQGGMGSDYEDPNTVNGISQQGFRGSIASNNRRNNQPPRNGRGNQQQPNNQRGGNQQPNNQRGGNQRGGNRPQPQRNGNERGGNQQPPNQQPQNQRNRNQPPRPQPQRNGNGNSNGRNQQQQPANQQRQPQRQPQRPPQRQPQRPQQRQNQRGNRSQSPGDFSVEIQHQQRQPQLDFLNSLQSMDPQNAPQDLIEQSSVPEQNSIARAARPNSRPNSKSIGRSRGRSNALFGPPQQFNAQQNTPQQPQQSPRQQPQQSSRQQSQQSPPQQSSRQQSQQPPQQSQQPPQQSQQQPPQDEQSLNNLPLPSPDLNSRQQQLTEIQQASSSNQVNQKVNAQSQQKTSNNRIRKVIRKKAKKAYLDRGSLPLESLVSSASEIEQSVHHLIDHYVPALPVDINYGKRISRSDF